MSISAMKQALENCEALLLSAGFESSDVYAEVCFALKQAEKAQGQEPVDKVGSLYPDFWDWLPKAYGDVDDELAFTKYNMEVAFAAGAEAEAKRMWVGLTDEELDAAEIEGGNSYRQWTGRTRGQMLMPQDDFQWHVSRAIEAKLKEKNT